MIDFSLRHLNFPFNELHKRTPLKECKDIIRNIHFQIYLQLIYVSRRLVTRGWNSLFYTKK
jgi:hypothetical protein